MKYMDVLGTAYLIEELPPEQMEGNEGTAECSLERITIDSTMGRQRKAQRLIHEVIHIIEVAMQLNMTEKQVVILSEVLYSLGFRVETYTKEDE